MIYEKIMITIYIISFQERLFIEKCQNMIFNHISTIIYTYIDYITKFI